MKRYALLLGALVSTSCAAASEWRTSWDGILYGYADHARLRNDSPFNPVVAPVTRNSATGDLRVNLKAENDYLRLTLRPIVQTQDINVGGQAYLSQWQLRLRASDAWSIAAGRELLNWGPAQFRSPSSPFYFDNGRSNPMRELSGVDTLKLSWNPDIRQTLTLAHIAGSGHVAQDNWRDTWLLKADQRGADWAGGLIAARTQHRQAFFGAYGQMTMNDMLLVYTELSSATNALNAPAGTALPFPIAPSSSRKLTGLAGLSYTFEDGRSLAAEYLHYAHGYTTAQERAYFQLAITQPALTLGLAPALLGRDYLHLVWQSNMMESSNYWRLMLTHNLTDSSNELAGYGEYSLDPRISVFVLGALPTGSANQEFSSLFRYNITTGLKFALP